MKVVVVVLFMIGSLFIYNADDSSGQARETTPEETFIPEKPLELTIQLKRVYLDGEISEETVKETILTLDDFWAKYESWQLVDMDEERLVFEKKVNDISPLLKINGYFGLDDDGTLSIFNGKPDQSDVIQSFFQIDIKKLESNQHIRLKEGIPIKTKEEFSEVLETMEPYSVGKRKK